jgi:hypothetical protein
MRITGYITRRRCVGKHLAFADIRIEECSNDDGHELHDCPTHAMMPSTAETVQVIFRRRGPDDPAWRDGRSDAEGRHRCQPRIALADHPFPHKDTALPHGALVSLDVSESVTIAASLSVANKENKSYAVRAWTILVNPREEAINVAKQGHGTEALSCSKYLKSRREAFMRFNAEIPTYVKKKSVGRASTNTAPMMILSGSTDSAPDCGANNVETNEGDFSHGDNRAKALRARIFASWLINTYGRDFLGGEKGVLDVAGGKGKLSIELSLQGKIHSTVVDPLVRKHGESLEPRDAKKIRKVGAPHPKLLPREFNQTAFLQECEDSVTQSSILVGLHPDECTEDILDIALQYDKAVAIVPCCVFSGFLPIRHLPCGRPVRTYEEFLEYLALKDDRLQQHQLPFQGRNVVIYMAPSQRAKQAMF